MKQCRRNYDAIENAFNTGSPKLVRARAECSATRTTHTRHVCPVRRLHSTRNAFARRRRRHFQWHGLCTKCYSFSAVASTPDWSADGKQSLRHTRREAMHTSRIIFPPCTVILSEVIQKFAAGTLGREEAFTVTRIMETLGGTLIPR